MFDISHAFLSLTVAKLSTLKGSPVFGPPYNAVASVEQIVKFSCAGVPKMTLLDLQMPTGRCLFCFFCFCVYP